MTPRVGRLLEVGLASRKWTEVGLVDCLSKSESRDRYRALIDDPLIGPNAPKDGDILQWWSLAIVLILGDLWESASVGQGTEVEGVVGADPSPVADGGADVSSFEELEADFKAAGLKLFHRLFSSAEPSMLNRFRDLHGALLVDLRRYWGGRMVRIPARPRRPSLDDEVPRLLREGVPIPEIQRLTGGSRSAIYKVLSRKVSR